MKILLLILAYLLVSFAVAFLLGNLFRQLGRHDNEPFLKPKPPEPKYKPVKRSGIGKPKQGFSGRFIRKSIYNDFLQKKREAES